MIDKDSKGIATRFGSTPGKIQFFTRTTNAAHHKRRNRLRRTIQLPILPLQKFLAGSVTRVASVRFCSQEIAIRLTPASVETMIDTAPNELTATSSSTIRTTARTIEDAMVKANAVLQRAGLAKRGERPARQLSLGQRKRAAIVASFINSPELFILDEPTAELVASSRREVSSLLASHSIAMLIARHDLEFLQGLTGRVLALDEDRVIENLPATEFVNGISL